MPMKNQLNQLGKEKTPFLFIIDFEVKNFYIAPLNKLDNHILFSIDGFSNVTANSHVKNFSPPPFHLKKTAISLEKYTIAFNHVIKEMIAGNTYLLNLTFPTEIEVNAPLLNIFLASHAKFRLYFKNKFVTFSPERFIKIEQNLIKTYPMKGTINAFIPNAPAKILADEKEKAEHTMAVDLLRNDLSIVAKKVRVNKFRYIEKIKAGPKELLQVSSEIAGVLEKSWHEKIGDILLSLLPAGSISGAPKRKTVEIINAVEGYKRGFFTGVFGYFDGHKLDSGVMIRFIERNDDKLIYKSGGGITIDSNVIHEYEEMLEKVYIPTT
ncbi:MAG: aminodeoxychorismate synthase component I [Candidatus Parabeggiatoa sp. nov. 1]|nr:MAG: aminodeoxychorismate synthase component I [Gammaproteobacteria bacterium]